MGGVDSAVEGRVSRVVGGSDGRGVLRVGEEQEAGRGEEGCWEGHV